MNNSNPLFSIIIPTYNHAHLIGKCLDSLLSQPYKSWEAIVVNNFSEDNTINVVEGYNDNRIRLINNANEGIIAVSRNKGLEEAKGDWICFLDSDDWWYPNKLDEFVKNMDNFDFLYHLVDIYDVKTAKLTGKKIGRKIGANPFKDLIINGNGIANSSVAIRKSICQMVGNISEDKLLVAVEDYDYWLRVAKFTNKIELVNLSLGAYYWDGDSNISQISKNRISKEITIFEKYKPFLSQSEEKQATYIFHYKIGRYYGVLKDYSLAKKYLFNSIRSNDYLIKLKSTLFFLKFFLK